MAIPLHDHFAWTARARQELDNIAEAYRTAGHDPILLAICWAKVRLNSGGEYQTPFVAYYCADDKHQFPDDEIGIIDGVRCVFFLLDDAKKRFWDKVLDWEEPGRWVLLDRSPGKPGG